MNHIIDIAKFALIALAILIVGLQAVSSLNTYVKNQAIDGCAQSTFYQNEYTDAEGRHVTNREPQKSLYEKCLIQKGVSLSK